MTNSKSVQANCIDGVTGEQILQNTGKVTMKIFVTLLLIQLITVLIAMFQ